MRIQHLYSRSGGSFTASRLKVKIQQCIRTRFSYNQRRPESPRA